ncbi:MAG TPA: MBL fold metallo-hydrolase [Candidatus Paceibacterota bacterium]|nr:MBL fold metallo-hydrolase [Candidatus Paceibacterota bacterium]
MTNKAKITFCSGAGTVTGANFLFEINEKKFLIDCGMIQNSKLADEINWDPFPYNAGEVEILFVTHAHIDHVGRIPKLIQEGFRGRIISSIPSKDIADLMMRDTAGILTQDDANGLEIFFNEKNINLALSLWETYDYNKEIKLSENITVTLKDAGHILGSAMICFRAYGKNIVFTGDLGNSPSPILPDTEILKDVDYLIMESVYGDRNHESRDERKKKLEKVIEDNYGRKGVLIIPTFSLERSQELLFEINDFVENNRIPPMPVYIDSPLAIKLTAVYSKYTKYLNSIALGKIKEGDDIFNFPGLRVTLSTDESKGILKVPSPKIIMAGSGMSMGGRIVHHEKNYLPDKNNTLLLIGFQSLGTMGRLIEEGAKKIRITGQDVMVNAHIEKISGYSGHKDSDSLISFVETNADSLKKVFCVMGEPKSAMFLAQKIRDYLGVEAISPGAGDVYEINL